MAHDITLPFETNRVHCMSYMTGLPRLPGACADFIYAECPVGAHDFFEPCKRVLKPTGAFLLRSEPGEWCRRWRERLKAIDFRIVHSIKTVDFNFTRPFDYMLVGARDGFHFQGKGLPPDEIIHPRTPEEDRICLAQRDVETYLDLVRLCTREGALVLELCAGSASLGVACIRSGRHYLGFENATEMAIKANDRLKAVTDKNHKAGEANHG